MAGKAGDRYFTWRPMNRQNLFLVAYLRTGIVNRLLHFIDVRLVNRLRRDMNQHTRKDLDPQKTVVCEIIHRNRQAQENPEALQQQFDEEKRELGEGKNGMGKRIKNKM